MQQIIMAIVMGLLYWACRTMIGGYFAFHFLGSPVVAGLLAGIISGDMATGLVIGGGIALVFAGIIAPGGNLPTDSALAGTCVIPIALTTGMSVEAAIALAVPVGLLGAFLVNIRKTVNIVFLHKAQKCAEEGNIRGINNCATIYPALTSLLYLFLPVFIINMISQDAVLAVFDALPEFIIHGLEVAGGVLPALGFALIMNMIGKPKMVPYVIFGFIAVKTLAINNVVAGVLGAALAALIIFAKRDRAAE